MKRMALALALLVFPAVTRAQGHPSVFLTKHDVALIRASGGKYPLFARSLAAGRPGYDEAWQASFVDGAGGRSVLPSMWPLLAGPVAGAIVVSLSETAAAMKLAAERAHIIAEGAAACAIAAALTGRAGSGTVVAVVSGGNIDLTRFAALVGACV